MATLENVYVTICIIGLCVLAIVTMLCLVLVVIGLTVKAIKSWREEDGATQV